MTTRSRPPCRPRMRGLQGKPKRLSSYTTSRDATGVGKRTRIRATKRLIDKLQDEQTGLRDLARRSGVIPLYEPHDRQEPIILKDSRKNEIPYEDTLETLVMKERLARINAKLAATRITLKLPDEKWPELYARLQAKISRDHGPVNFTHTQLFRVFNNSRFDHGGRFYGGWWQAIPREFRPYIDINHKPTVELDYSGHHARILYARVGLPLPKDPYDLEGFERDDQKQAFNTILNARKRSSAVKSLSSEGIRDASALCNALEKRHAPISQFFYTGVGLELQYLDSQVAEEVMLRMLDRGAAVLPMHDSFIVRNSYENELWEVMAEVFQEQFAREAGIKPKVTVLELDKPQTDERGFASLDLDTLLGRYETYRRIFGL